MDELSLMEDAVHYLDVSGNLQCIKDAAANFQFMLKVCFLLITAHFIFTCGYHIHIMEIQSLV